MTTQAASLLERVTALHDAIARGEIVEALHEYYAENVEMQEGLQPPTVGLAANLEREQAWLATVAEFKNFEVKSLAVEGDTTFAETVLDYVDTDGNAIHGEQVARARWKDGKIVHERFYGAS